ncbi:hypothetical protein [Methanosarcina mazei]|nr:hypothetical protein [Methanosarcina mazei]
MSRERKILFILLTLTFTLPLLMFNGSIDDFAPKHIIIINDLSENSFLSTEHYNIQVPGYYILGAILKQVVNLSTKSLLFYPIQLIPYVIVFFTLIYKLSNNYIFSALITFIEFISGATGTTKIFLWVHGIGSILFYISIILLLNAMKENQSKKPEVILLLIISGSSLVFISYNLFAMLLIFLISVFVIFTIFNTFKFNLYINNPSAVKSISKFLQNICLILIAVELGLSDFFYRSMVPTLKQSQYFELSGIEKLLVYYFNRSSETALGDFILSFPHILSIISGIKYTILLCSIFIFFSAIRNKIIERKPINQFDLVTGAFVLMTGIYGFVRLYIGGVIVTLLYIPGILCTAWLYRFSRTYRSWTLFVLILLLILVPVYEFNLYSNKLTNIDKNNFGSINDSSSWYFRHTTDSIAVSDELTKNLFLLYFYENTHNFNNPDVYNSIQSLFPKDVLFLAQRSTPTITSEKYYIINYKLNANSLQNWIVIKSWNYSRIQLEENHLINNIYETNSISIFN